MRKAEPLIFELSRPGRGATAQYPARARRPRCPRPFAGAAAAAARGVGAAGGSALHAAVAAQFRHRHAFLSARLLHDEVQPAGLQFARDAAGVPGPAPAAPTSTGQGVLACLFELQEMLKHVTGMAGVSLTPMAGAQGEFAGVAMIRAYHRARGDRARNEIIVPDAAHGTNPATATMCGMKVREIPTLPTATSTWPRSRPHCRPRRPASC